jgi:hypothetical protein
MNRALLKRILRLLSYAMLIMLIILMIYSGLFEFTKTDSLIELLTFTVTRFGGFSSAACISIGSIGTIYHLSFEGHEINRWSTFMNGLGLHLLLLLVGLMMLF